MSGNVTEVGNSLVLGVNKGSKLSVIQRMEQSPSPLPLRGRQGPLDDLRTGCAISGLIPVSICRLK